MRPVSFENATAVIGTTIVQENDLKILPGLLQQILDTLLQKNGVIIIGYDNRKECRQFSVFNEIRYLNLFTNCVKTSASLRSLIGLSKYLKDK